MKNYEYPFDYPPPMEKPKVLLPAMLFLATVVTTVMAGALYQGADIFDDPYSLVKGVPFSLSLLLILGTHELGHFLASRRHGVVTTLPTFIPGPPIPPMIGTFGAVIRIKSPITTKAALVEIGASGPLAGFVIALFVTWWGLDHSTIVPRTMAAGSLGGDHLLVGRTQAELPVGPVPETHDVLLHPVAFAGWIGFFVTAMNLLPIGQLDGGHLVYSLLGARHRQFSMVMIGVLIVLGILSWPGWFVWAALITIIGIWHPPVEDQREPMDPKRRLIAMSALAVFVLTFIPTPFYIV